MDLPLEDEELVESLVLLHHPVIVLDLDDGLLEVPLDALVPALRHAVPLQVELLLRLVGNLHAFLGRVVVAEPLPDVVAVVDVGAEDEEASPEGLLALEALLLVLSWGDGLRVI